MPGVPESPASGMRKQIEAPATHEVTVVRNRRGGAISSKVFVGNLSFDTTKDELQSVFAEVGEIMDVVLPTDRATGRPRGFAFVEYSSDDSAATAIQKFDGFELGGRNLRVNEAEKRVPRVPRLDGPSGAESFGPDGFGAGSRPPRSKGSRRNIRSRKRSFG